MEERATFILSSELKKEVEQKAKEQGMSMSTYIRALVIKDLKKGE